MDYFNPAEAFKAGYAATEAVSTDIQSKDILRQAYAGQDANTGTPQGDLNVYQKAARMAGMSGNASLAHQFTKQAADASKLIEDQQKAELTNTQGRLALASQYIKGATDDTGLVSAVDAAGLPAQAKQQVLSIIQSNLPFEQKQAKIAAIGQTIDQDLRAQQIALNGGKTAEELKIKQQRLAETRVQDAYRRGEVPDPNDVRIAKGQDAAAVNAGAQPKSVRLNNPLNLTDPKTGEIKKFDTIEEGTAAGKADLAGKLDGTSPAYKSKFGNKPVTPERLAETWSPANAKGNSLEATANYAKAIAKAAGVEINQPIPKTSGVQDKVFNAMAAFEAGSGSGDVNKAGLPTDRQERTQQLEEAYTNAPLNIQKKVAGLAPLGVEYGIEPRKMPTLGAVELKTVEANYEVMKKTEDIAQRLKDNPAAAGTLASLVHKYGAMTEQSLNNIQKDKAYTRDVAILGKELLTLALEDAAGASGGRMNQYLEKAFRGVYDQSLSAETLTDLLKTRQADSAKRIENKIIGAKRENLDPEQYKLMNSKGGKEYLGDAKAQQAEEMKNRPPISSFGGPVMGGGSFDQRLQSLGVPRQPGQ